MNKTLLHVVLALIAWVCLGSWAIARMLQPAFLLDFLRMVSLC